MATGVGKCWRTGKKAVRYIKKNKNEKEKERRDAQSFHTWRFYPTCLESSSNNGIPFSPKIRLCQKEHFWMLENPKSSRQRKHGHTTIPPKQRNWWFWVKEWIGKKVLNGIALQIASKSCQVESNTQCVECQDCQEIVIGQLTRLDQIPS